MWVHDNDNHRDFCTIGLILQDGIGDVLVHVRRMVEGRVLYQFVLINRGVLIVHLVSHFSQHVANKTRHLLVFSGHGILADGLCVGLEHGLDVVGDASNSLPIILSVCVVTLL